jgi:hypothetical protein
MKSKMVKYIFTITLLLLINGCSVKSITKYSFRAKVLENVTENGIMVELLEDSRDLKMGEKIFLQLNNSGKSEHIYLIGTKVEIIYDGNIEESKPPHISPLEIKIIK